MPALDIQKLCDEALQRILYFINRCAGQHSRAIKKVLYAGD